MIPVSAGSRRAGRGERLFAASLGLIFAVQFGLALRYPSDPRLFPLIVSAVGVLLAAAVALGFGLGGERAEEAADDAPPGPAPSLLALIAPPAYALALWLIGYWAATIIAIPLLAWRLQYRNVVVLALVTTGVAVAIGVLFPLVHVPLPPGLLFARAPS